MPLSLSWPVCLDYVCLPVSLLDYMSFCMFVPLSPLLATEPSYFFVTMLARSFNSSGYTTALLCVHPLSVSELAFQISEQFEALGAGIGLKSCVIVGGVGMYGVCLCI
jgi:hypothetical protein